MENFKVGDYVLVKSGISKDSQDLNGKVSKVLESKVMRRNLGVDMKHYFLIAGGEYGVWEKELTKVGIDKHGRAVDINGMVVSSEIISK